LGSLIIGGGVAEITACGQLGDFPTPGQKPGFLGINPYSAFQTERRPDSLQMQAGSIRLGAHGQLRLAMDHFDLPVGREPPVAPTQGIQDDNSQLGRVSRVNKRKNSRKKTEK
jgi:hypothetical protein